MKFVDEALLHVMAGKGGDGCVSFRREKFIPLGGPDGGDGGKGGDVYLEADSHFNTLGHFSNRRLHAAGNGQKGSGNGCSGKGGQDLIIKVPIGTVVYDETTHVFIIDLNKPHQRIKIACGGKGGAGNRCFKSSVNRAPRQFTPGEAGEAQTLKLELKLLADVGLLGLPNAGKSTLLRVLSHARPKVADYPFTTLHPHLGVVAMKNGASFVVADIPGLIEGAAQGAGLGIRFLKHLQRTRVLLHVIDAFPFEGHDPLIEAPKIYKELKAFSPALAQKPCWLVLNKMDLFAHEKDAENYCQKIIKTLNHKGPVYTISALAKKNVRALVNNLHAYLQTI